jgi:hypothetical protein
VNFSIHAMAATLLAALWKDGGGTIDPRTGELAKFRTGFLVSLSRYEKQFLYFPSVSEIASWLSHVAEGWRHSPNQLYPGIWYDRQNLLVCCDLNELVIDEVTAIEFAQHEQQNCIRKISTSTNISIKPARRAA